MVGRSDSDFCPYKGLLPYTEHDRQYFFGRKRDQEIIASNLYAAPLTVLHGASGVGKTSVLMAGVVPRLKETSRLAAVVFRNWQGDEFGVALKNQILLATRESFVGDVDKALELLAAGLNRKPGGAQRKLLPEDEIKRERLRREEETGQTIELARRWLNGEQNLDLRQCSLDTLIWVCTGALRAPVFLLLDQFEEYFLYHPPSEAGEGFEAEFARMINRQDIDVSVLLSMRDEGLSKLDRFEGRIPNLLGNTLRVEHLDREAAREAILSPLEVYNAQLPEADKVSIEGALVERLLDKARPDASTLSEAERTGAAQGDGRIETPVLQILLTRLWKQEITPGSRQLRLTTFEQKMGGEKQIVRTYLQEVIGSLSEAEQEVIAQVCKFLVTPTGTKQAQEVGALSAWTGLEEREVQALVTKLSTEEDMRILRKVTDLSRTERYEIFHDVLALSVKEWLAGVEKERARIKAERLAEAERVKREREAAEKQRELEQARALAAAEHRRAEEEQRRAEAEHATAEAQSQRAEAERRRAELQAKAARRLRVMVTALAVSLLLALAGAVIALTQRSRALSNESEARLAQTQATENAEVAKAAQVIAIRHENTAREAEAMALQALRSEQLSAQKAVKAQKIAEESRRMEAAQRVKAEKALRDLKLTQGQRDIAQTQRDVAQAERERLREDLGLKAQISEGRTEVLAETATQTVISSNALGSADPNAGGITPGPEVMRVNDAVLQQLMPKLPPDKRREYLPHLQRAMQEFEINTPLRQAAFLSQIAFESVQLQYLLEPWNPRVYTFQQRYEPPGNLARSLGNTQRGDGERYRGRGVIQITGRANYQRFGQVFNVDLVGNPDLALNPELTFRIAGAYWKAYGLNELADRQDFITVTKRINGGTNGLNERRLYYERAKRSLGVS